jgi:hypothetical protein
MSTAQQYRAKASEYESLLAGARSSGEASEWRELMQSYLALAENADWLAANLDRTVRPGDDAVPAMFAESALPGTLAAPHDE